MFDVCRLIDSPLLLCGCCRCPYTVLGLICENRRSEMTRRALNGPGFRALAFWVVWVRWRVFLPGCPGKVVRCLGKCQKRFADPARVFLIKGRALIQSSGDWR